MRMKEEDKEEIKRSACFLLQRGFSVQEDYDTVMFTDGQIDIIANYERYENISSLSIHYKKENETFNIGWIAFVRANLKTDCTKRLENILILMDYLQKNFEAVSDYDYCKESQNLVKRFVEDNLNRQL